MKEVSQNVQQGEERKLSVEEYRAEVAAVIGRLEEAKSRYHDARNRGEIEESIPWHKQLSAAFYELRKLPERLTPHGALVVNYRVEKLGPTRVSFAIPAGSSPCEFLAAAEQALVASGRGPLFADKESFLKVCKELQQPLEKESVFVIEGRFPGTEGKSHDEQRQAIVAASVKPASLGEAALGLAAHFAAHGEVLHGDDPRSHTATLAVSLKPGVGLGLATRWKYEGENAAMAARIPTDRI